MDGGNAYSQDSVKNLRRYAGLPSRESSVLREHRLLFPIRFRVQIVYLRICVTFIGGAINWRSLERSSVGNSTN